MYQLKILLNNANAVSLHIYMGVLSQTSQSVVIDQLDFYVNRTMFFWRPQLLELQSHLAIKFDEVSYFNIGHLEKAVSNSWKLRLNLTACHYSTM